MAWLGSDRVHFPLSAVYVLNVHNEYIIQLRTVQKTGTCYPGQGWFVRNLTGAPDKSMRGLGSMSWYSLQTLSRFLAYIFHIFIPLWVWLGTLPDCHHAECSLPFTVHCNQNGAGHQTIKSPSMPCWVSAGWKHSLVFMPQVGWNWRIKWMKAVSMGSCIVLQ